MLNPYDDLEPEFKTDPKNGQNRIKSVTLVDQISAIAHPQRLATRQSIFKFQSVFK